MSPPGSSPLPDARSKPRQRPLQWTLSAVCALSYPFSSLLILGSPARASIPVLRVHLYCSTPSNTVRAEWALMEYVPGQRIADCFGRDRCAPKTRTAKDLARRWQKCLRSPHPTVVPSSATSPWTTPNVRRMRRGWIRCGRIRRGAHKSRRRRLSYRSCQ